jgi:hypothetical protein
VSARSGVLAVALVAVFGIAALLVAAGGNERSTAFSLDVAPTSPVATLNKGQAACQGPITVTDPFGYVTPWISPFQPPGVSAVGAIPGAALAVTVRDATTNASLATGQVAGGYLTAIAPAVALTQTIPSGRRIRVCLRSRGPSTVQLLGAALANAAAMGDDGRLDGSDTTAMALLFIRRHPRSLLSLVPAILRRAALFRPGWVGPWTYWMLSVAFLAAFALAGLAVARAVRADGQDGDADTH